MMKCFTHIGKLIVTPSMNERENLYPFTSYLLG